MPYMPGHRKRSEGGRRVFGDAATTASDEWEQPATSDATLVKGQRHNAPRRAGPANNGRQGRLFLNSHQMMSIGPEDGHTVLPEPLKDSGKVQQMLCVDLRTFLAQINMATVSKRRRIHTHND